MKYGYARVSTANQKEDRQLDELVAYGISKSQIFVDKQSGKDFKRTSYIKLCKTLRSGDLLVIKSLDRLGRNYNEIQEQWRNLTKTKGVDIIVLDMPLLDTTNSKDLLGTFISDIVLQLLSFVAENERENILKRQAEGIAAAKKRGVKFGRPAMDIPKNYPKNYELWRNKKITAKDGAKNCNMPLWAFYQKKGNR